jgi:antitoxin VapB
MRLNIKNPEADRMARELAALTGKTITAAVTEAREERLNRIKNKGVPKRLKERKE